MRHLLWVLAVIASSASAQGLTPLAPGAVGGKVLASFAFGTVGCFASGTGGVAITRATASTYWDGAATQTCAAGSYRVEADGLLVEQARSNVVLSSTTHPKTGEATASIGTGLFQARHQGTGTMTLVAGSATVTGLSCTAVAAGTVCTGTVTVAGTLSITTTAGTTRAQVELGAYPTSWIDNASAVSAATRNADQVSATVPSVPLKWCIAVTAKLGGGRTSNDEPLWNLGTGAGANTARLTPTAFTVADAGAASRTSGGANFSGSSRIVACDTAGRLSFTRDGVTNDTDSGAGTGILGTPPTTLGFGVYPGYFWGGYLKNVKICAAKSWRECK